MAARSIFASSIRESPKHQPVSSRRSVSGVVAPAEQLNSPDTVCLAVTGGCAFYGPSRNRSTRTRETARRSIEVRLGMFRGGPVLLRRLHRRQLRNLCTRNCNLCTENWRRETIPGLHRGRNGSRVLGHGKGPSGLASCGSENLRVDWSGRQRVFGSGVVWVGKSSGGLVREVSGVLFGARSAEHDAKTSRPSTWRLFFCARRDDAGPRLPPDQTRRARQVPGPCRAPRFSVRRCNFASTHLCGHPATAQRPRCQQHFVVWTPMLSRRCDVKVG